MQTYINSFSPSFFFFSPLKKERCENHLKISGICKNEKKSVFHISSLWEIADVAFQQGENEETKGLCLYLKHSMAWACFDVPTVRLISPQHMT